MKADYNLKLASFLAIFEEKWAMHINLVVP